MVRQPGRASPYRFRLEVSNIKFARHAFAQGKSRCMPVRLSTTSAQAEGPQYYIVYIPLSRHRPSRNVSFQSLVCSSIEIHWLSPVVHYHALSSITLLFFTRSLPRSVEHSIRSSSSSRPPKSAPNSSLKMRHSSKILLLAVVAIVCQTASAATRRPWEQCMCQNPMVLAQL